MDLTLPPRSRPRSRPRARPRLVERLLLLARASALALPLSLLAAGCKDEGCLRWNDADRKANGAVATSGATTGGGGAGGASGATTGGGGAAASTPVTLCPDRALAKKLLANPSCSEGIDSVDDEGTFDSDTCCYEVTTKSKACPAEGAQ